MVQTLYNDPAACGQPPSDNSHLQYRIEVLVTQTQLQEVVPSWGTETRRMLRLFSPIFLGQIAQTSMSVVDTVMSGAAGTGQLSGVAVGGALFWPVLMAVMGMCFAISPIAAQLRGGGRVDLIAARMHLATVCCLIFSLLAAGVVMLLPGLYAFMPGINQEMVRVGTGYLIAVGAGVPGFALFNLLRSYSEGLGNTMPTLIFGFIALFLNIPLNYVFIFGKCGMPELGGIGCGVATSITIYLTALLFLIYVQIHPFYASCRIYRRLYKITREDVRRYLHLGIPLSLSAMIEVACFSLTSFLLSPFGPVMVAAHSIAMNVSGLLFMFTYSMANAVTIRAGEAMGALHWNRARRSMLTALGLGLIFVVVNTLIVLLLRHEIIGLYTSSQEVWALAEWLLFLCVIYQLPDCIQVISLGVLRGFKDSRTIFRVTIISYWLVAMPLGSSLAYGWIGLKPMAAQGFWLGFIAGLMTCALIYTCRLYYLFRRRVVPAGMRLSI